MRDSRLLICWTTPRESKSMREARDFYLLTPLCLPIEPLGGLERPFPYSKFISDFNPFETKTKVSNVESEPVKQSEETPVDETPTENELNVTFEPPKRAPPKLGQNRKPIKKKTPKVEKSETPKSEEPKAEEALPAKGAYNVDFDKFDDPSKLGLLFENFEKLFRFQPLRD